MTRYLFVGERRSPSAVRMRVTWRHGRLAARPLFAALVACGVDPAADCRFANLYPDAGPLVPRPDVLRRCRRFAGVVVALGRRVQRALARAGVPFVPIVHPAARGKIRKARRYRAHVAAALTGRSQ